MKIIFIIAGFVGVVVVVGGYLIWRQYPSCSDGMCTYRNEEYGFEFRYPETLSIDNNPQPISPDAGKQLPHWVVTKDNTAVVYIDIRTQSDVDQSIATVSDEVTKNEISIDGVQGKIYRYFMVDRWKSLEVAPLDKYVISFGFDDSHTKDANSILSTFKLLRTRTIR